MAVVGLGRAFDGLGATVRLSGVSSRAASATGAMFAMTSKSRRIAWPSAGIGDVAGNRLVQVDLNEVEGGVLDAIGPAYRRSESAHRAIGGSSALASPN